MSRIQMAHLMLHPAVARQPGVTLTAAGFCSPISLPENMRCLTNSETHQWLAGQGMHHRPLDCGVPIAGDYPISTERRNRLMLADYLADLLSKNGNKLVEILPGPHEDTEDWELLHRFRARLGEPRPLLTSPAHLFKSGDRQEFRIFLSQLLGSQRTWTFYIYAAPSRTTLLVGDRIEIWSHKKGMCNELGRYLTLPQAA